MDAARIQLHPWLGDSMRSKKSAMLQLAAIRSRTRRLATACFNQ
jgi:hypothetical protein